MIEEYLNQKLKTARYKTLEDKTFFGEISSTNGVWANAKTLEACRAELKEVLEEWVLLKVRDREAIPGFKLQVDKRGLKEYA